MLAKALEIRDRVTFIAALAVDMNPRYKTIAAEHCPHQHYLLSRCGYPCGGAPNIILTKLNGSGKATNDPYDWGDRTWHVAHKYIIEHWAELNDGDVIDVEFILGETSAPKLSERVTP